ncbi:MAG: DUF5703 domain-containing protein, partial [Faecousia sp.]
MKKLLSVFLLIGMVLSMLVPGVSAAELQESVDVKQALDEYNVSWDTTSNLGSAGSMPIGNGDITANVWVEQDGTLNFYIGKSDAWSEATRLLKIGKVKVKLTDKNSNAIAPENFNQTLKLYEGEMTLDIGGVNLTFWIDANKPVIHVEASSESNFRMEVSTEIWRDKEIAMNSSTAGSYVGLRNGGFTPTESADVVAETGDDSVVWYHRNTHSYYDKVLATQRMTEAEVGADPYVNRTFGACLKGEDMTASADGKTISSQAGTTCAFAVYPYTAQTETVAEWESGLKEMVEAVDAVDTAKAHEAHQAWWEEFWNRSYIFITGDAAAETVTRGYIMQRFMQAIQGRANYPIKFNGGTINFDYAKDGSVKQNADFRFWGPGYWFQNTRHLYWNMLASGDYEMMKPWFKMYMDILPVQMAETRKLYDHEGAFFPETMEFHGLYHAEDFGWNNNGTEAENGYIRQYWQSGLEMSAMMLEYFDYTQDEAFVRNTLVPFAEQAVNFFDQHYRRNAEGVLEITPANALETYWGATNPAELVAGLKRVLTKLLELPASLTTDAQKAVWTRLLGELPQQAMGKNANGAYIKPAEVYSGTANNSENPELYPIFPYKQYCVGTEELAIGVNTSNNRRVHATGCWTQDAIDAAYLGLSGEAKRCVTDHFSRIPGDVRFPGFWSQGNDWMPDLDNGGSGMMALQAMLLQAEGSDMYVFPAWPQEWNAEFKLHAPNQTAVTGVYTDGAVESLTVDGGDWNVVLERPEAVQTNLALDILPTSSASAPTLLERITDGSNSELFSTNGTGTQWIQVDLGESYDLNDIKLWQWRDRTFHDVIIQVSNDPEFKTGVTTVFNNDMDNSAGQGVGTDTEYPETGALKDFPFESVNARYVRCWSNGSTANTDNIYVELQVYAATPELHTITADEVENGHVTFTVEGVPYSQRRKTITLVHAVRRIMRLEHRFFVA